MSKKIYYIQVEDYEAENIELAIRQKITEMIAKEITEHSRLLATQILDRKPLIKKKWYEVLPDNKLKDRDDDQL